MEDLSSTSSEMSFEPGELRRSNNKTTPRSVARANAARELEALGGIASTSRKSNRFALLANSDVENVDDQSATTRKKSAVTTAEALKPRPPPIFLPDITNIKEMVDDLKRVAGPDSFFYKAGREGRIRSLRSLFGRIRAVVSHIPAKVGTCVSDRREGITSH